MGQRVSVSAAIGGFFDEWYPVPAEFISRSSFKDKFVRNIRLFPIAIITIALILSAAWFAPYLLLLQYFNANPANGYHAGFYLYISPNAKQAAREGQQITILVQPNNSGTNSDNPKIHRRDAWWTGLERRAIADELGVALLVPAFIRPGDDWQIYTHALDRDTFTTTREDLNRIDLQLLAMID